MKTDAKKKILIFADWYEPGYKAGGPIQSVRNFVAAMHTRYEISILTSDTDLGEPHPYKDIPSNKWITDKQGVRIYYASRKHLRRSVIKSLIRAEKPDFIYLNSLYSVRFSIIPLLLLWTRKVKAQYILSPRGMLRDSAIRIKTKRKKLFIGFLNQMRIPELIRFHATDAQEQKDIRRYFPRFRNVQLIPNFSAPLPDKRAPIKKSPGSIRLVFISRIMDIKNILFFLKLLNQVPVQTEIIFSIYGEIEDPVYWQECLAVIQFLPRHVTATYLGPLEHVAVVPAMEQHHVFVLPTRGENFGHAIFESFSAGRPAMISNTTPWLGLRKQEIGWDLSLDAPDNWVTAIEEAAAFDQAKYDQWSLKARAFAQSKLEDAEVLEGYLGLFS